MTAKTKMKRVKQMEPPFSRAGDFIDYIRRMMDNPQTPRDRNGFLILPSPLKQYPNRPWPWEKRFQG